MPAKQKKCVGGGHDGEIIRTALEEQQCIREEGRPVEVPDAGAQRITFDLVAEQFRLQTEDGTPAEGGWSTVDSVERLMLFPICTLLNQVPASELLSGLDAFNRSESAALRDAVAGDERLKSELSQFVIDLSSVAASVLDVAATGRGGTFTIPDELLDRGERIARSLGAQTDDDGLATDLARLVDLGTRIRGTRLEDTLTALGGHRAQSA